MDFDRKNKISWFPGHMLKAEREIKNKLSMVDVIIEVLDARAPGSARNDRLAEAFQHKAHVLVMMKCDLADRAVLEAWRTHYTEDMHIPCICLEHLKRKGVVQKLASVLQKADQQRRTAAGAVRPRLRPLRSMVVGLPNVGKSTLINMLVNRKHTQTGPKPGVTRHQQWVKVGTDLELLDTPGIMIPSIPTTEVGLRLGLVATIKDGVAGVERMVEYLLYFLDKTGNSEFMRLYSLGFYPKDVLELLEAVGQKQGFLLDGGTVNRELVATRIIKDFREGRFGKICLDTLDEIPNAQ